MQLTEHYLNCTYLDSISLSSSLAFKNSDCYRKCNDLEFCH